MKWCIVRSDYGSNPEGFEFCQPRLGDLVGTLFIRDGGAPSHHVKPRHVFDTEAAAWKGYAEALRNQIEWLESEAARFRSELLEINAQHS